jgi:subtilase family serine protease
LLLAFALIATATLAAPGPGAGAVDTTAQAHDRRVDLVLGLRRDQRGLNQLAREVSSPASPSYGDYLRPRQLGRRFGATSHVARTVRGFLRRRGIPSRIDATRGFVEALPPAHRARRLFGTASGHKRVPAKLRGKVRQVLIGDVAQGQFLSGDKPPGGSGGTAASLETSRGGNHLTPPHIRTGMPAGCPRGRNTSHAYPDSPVAGPGWTPNQIQSAYHASDLHDQGVTGKGVTVAIYGAGGYGRRELRAFAACFDLRVPHTDLVKIGQSRAGSTTGEAALDLQMATLMAPGVDELSVYSIASGFWPAGFSAMLDARNAPAGHRPNVISVSQGDCETDDGNQEIRLTEYVLAAAAASGTTVTAGSSDAGAFCPSGPRIGFYPSSSRWMTSVGGTAFELNRRNRIVDEVPWNDKAFAPSLGAAGGGGYSHYLRRPPYQRDLRGWGDRRGYPDVALIADLYPGISRYCNENAEGVCDPNAPGNPFEPGGGTSYATPLMAGIVALADQRLLAQGRPPLGFLNPLLYRLGRHGGDGAERDIVKGSIQLNPSVPCCKAHRGFDLASGWGSVNAKHLAAIALERGPGAP